MRVIVNRIWKQHFGTGIVDTPSNFGVAGERPTNPELLEYLAQTFVDERHVDQGAAPDDHVERGVSAQHGERAANVEKDAGNRLYWRANRHRMTAEQMRDSLLLVSGALDAKTGGPSAPLTPFFSRRTVYGKVSRYKLDDYLQLFDFPSANLSAEKRFTTTVPLQRLFFMNSDFMQQQAELLARRVVREADNGARIQKAYRLIFGRAPTAAELQAGLAFIATEPLKDYEERKSAEVVKATHEGHEDADAAEPSTNRNSRTCRRRHDGRRHPGRGAARGRKQLLPVTPWGRYLKILLELE